MRMSSVVSFWFVLMGALILNVLLYRVLYDATGAFQGRAEFASIVLLPSAVFLNSRVLYMVIFTRLGLGDEFN